MALYPFTKSPLCLCYQTNIATTQQLAGQSKDSAVWALIGVACLCAGAMFAAMELTGDTLLLAADQLFLRVIKRKGTRSTSRGNLRREEAAGPSKALTSPSLNARAGYGYALPAGSFPVAVPLTATSHTPHA